MRRVRRQQKDTHCDASVPRKFVEAWDTFAGLAIAVWWASLLLFGESRDSMSYSNLILAVSWCLAFYGKAKQHETSETINVSTNSLTSSETRRSHKPSRPAKARHVP